MRPARHATHRGLAAPRTAPVPAVLPQVTVTVDERRRARVTLDGIDHSDRPVSGDELGGVLAGIAERAGGPVRVEVREPDGSRYADILQPRPRPTATGTGTGSEEQASPVEVPMLRGEGFLPGEPVLVAVVTTTIDAGPDGTVSLTDLPLRHRPAGAAILFGSTSATTVRGSLPERPAGPGRRWRRR